ncbi:MAG: insulinase family protein [Parachlamydiales bacterium]|nr:insulinase family protein [Parachlamydiales bacterium]
MFKPELTQENGQYKNFLITKHVYIEEIHSYFTQLTHVPSGANIVHIGNEDSENLFSIFFPTYCTNSRGVPHILEHLVLCGSKKFPVKDPFFSMLKRSLNTFMNAMTGTDFTCYPASTQIEKDFYHLLEVYLDAVFHPLLHRLSFLQEGYRLEFSEVEDSSSPLTHKGVVFNEMKGAYSSPQTRLWKTVMEHLLPDLPFRFDSGGDPKHIPHVTYQELKEFHHYYYHPSHATFFFYGNFSLKKHLDFLEKKALFGIEKIAPLSPILPQKRFENPKIIHTDYPIAPEESTDKKTFITFTWLTVPITEQETVLALTLLDSILMDNDASPLCFALLQSGLCSQAHSYLDSEMNEAIYAIMCKGCNLEDLEKLQQILENSLKKIIQEGISQKLIEASMHQLEFSRSEISREEQPYGLTLFFRSILPMQHGADPENGLMIHSLFKTLQTKLQDPLYLPSLIQKYFLDNRHSLCVTMAPNPTLAQKEQKEEESYLQSLQEHLSPKESKHIVEQSKALYDYQKSLETQSIECLPKITLKDIFKHTIDYSLIEENKENAQLFFHDTFTNNITYVDLALSFPHIPSDLLSELFFFSSILFQIGSTKRTYSETLSSIQSHIGGVGAYLSRHIFLKDPSLCAPAFHIRGKALDKHLPFLFEIIQEQITSADFSNTKRIEELLRKKFTHIQNSIPQNALSYAITQSQSGMDLPSYLSYRWLGLSYYYEMKNMIENIPTELPKLIEKLEYLHHLILHMHSPHLIVTSSSKTYSALHKKDFYGLLSLPQHPQEEWTGKYPLPQSLSQARIIASPVASTCVSYHTVGYTHKDAPALLVATNLLTNLYLHKKIREEGGAYGGGANYSPSSGKFYFYSYRDPHIARSVHAFKRSVESLLSQKFSSEDLEEAKLGILQHIDAPISIGSRGITAYGWHKVGKTLEQREKFRHQIIHVTKEQITNALQNHLLPQINQGVVVTFGEKNFLQRENLELAKNNQQLSLFPV